MPDNLIDDTRHCPVCKEGRVYVLLPIVIECDCCRTKFAMSMAPLDERMSNFIESMKEYYPELQKSGVSSEAQAKIEGAVRDKIEENLGVRYRPANGPEIALTAKDFSGGGVRMPGEAHLAGKPMRGSEEANLPARKPAPECKRCYKGKLLYHGTIIACHCTAGRRLEVGQCPVCGRETYHNGTTHSNDCEICDWSMPEEEWARHFKMRKEDVVMKCPDCGGAVYRSVIDYRCAACKWTSLEEVKKDDDKDETAGEEKPPTLDEMSAALTDPSDIDEEEK